jgi:hypothetical protein
MISEGMQVISPSRLRLNFFLKDVLKALSDFALQRRRCNMEVRSFAGSRRVELLKY